MIRSGRLESPYLDARVLTPFLGARHERPVEPVPTEVVTEPEAFDETFSEAETVPETEIDGSAELEADQEESNAREFEIAAEVEAEWRALQEDRSDTESPEPELTDEVVPSDETTTDETTTDETTTDETTTDETIDETTTDETDSSSEFVDRELTDEAERSRLEAEAEQRALDAEGSLEAPLAAPELEDGGVRGAAAATGSVTVLLDTPFRPDNKLELRTKDGKYRRSLGIGDAKELAPGEYVLTFDKLALDKAYQLDHVRPGKFVRQVFTAMPVRNMTKAGVPDLASTHTFRQLETRTLDNLPDRQGQDARVDDALRAPLPQLAGVRVRDP